MKRLELIVELLKGYQIALDIGCDHGLVLKKALDYGYIKQGIAVDIAQGPLNNAKTNLANYPVKFFQSDGFSNVFGKYDVVIIAGLGFEQIKAIMLQPHLNCTFILAPQNKVDNLRAFLWHNNYQIVAEKVAYEGFYYPIIVTQRGSVNFSEDDFLVGPFLKEDLAALGYYQHLLDYYFDLSKKQLEPQLSKTKQNIEVLETIIDRLRSLE